MFEFYDLMIVFAFVGELLPETRIVSGDWRPEIFLNSKTDAFNQIEFYGVRELGLSD